MRALCPKGEGASGFLRNCMNHRSTWVGGLVISLCGSSLKTCRASIIFVEKMRLNITPAVRQLFKKLASEGGKARAKKYDHQTLSQWAKLGGRRKNSAEARNPRKK